MSNNPEDIRNDIEQTQSDLSRDVDVLAEKVDPAKAVERQKDRLRDRFRGVRESVMGSPDDDEEGALHQAGDRAQDLAQQAGDAVQEMPDQVASKTRGNPLAAGLIAFGAGWLAASLIPSSRVEQEAAGMVKEQAQPLVDEAKSAAQDAGEHLKPQAQEAAAAVKDTASEGLENVKDEGQDQAGDLKDESQRAARHVKNTATDDSQT